MAETYNLSRERNHTIILANMWIVWPTVKTIRINIVCADHYREILSCVPLKTLGYASDIFLLHMLGRPKHLFCNPKDIQSDMLPLKISDISDIPQETT